MLKLANSRKLFDDILANKGLNVYLCSNNQLLNKYFYGHK